MHRMYDPHLTQSWNFNSWLEALSDASDSVRIFKLSSPTRTVAYQELIQLSLRYLKFPMRGKYTSTTQDLRTIASQSAQDDLSLEAPATAEESNRASSQLWIHWKSRCPI